MQEVRNLTWTEANVIKPFFQIIGWCIILTIALIAWLAISLDNYEPTKTAEVETVREIGSNGFPVMYQRSLKEEQELHEALVFAQTLALKENYVAITGKVQRAIDTKDYGLAIATATRYQYAEDAELNRLLDEARTKFLSSFEIRKSM